MEKAENTQRRPILGWCNEAPAPIRWRYLRGLSIGVAAYALALFVSLRVLAAFPEAPWRFAVALAPMIPMIFVLRVYLWYLRQLDELWRQIYLEGLAFAFAATAMTVLAYSLLQKVGFPDLSWVVVWLVMSLSWVVGHLIAAHRYR
jgi:hypothetical protein